MKGAALHQARRWSVFRLDPVVEENERDVACIESLCQSAGDRIAAVALPPRGKQAADERLREAPRERRPHECTGWRGTRVEARGWPMGAHLREATRVQVGGLRVELEPLDEGRRPGGPADA